MGFRRPTFSGSSIALIFALFTKKFYSRSFSPALSSSELRACHLWVAVFSSLHPRIPRPVNRRPDLAVYTAAALLSRKIAALVLSSHQSSIPAVLLAVATTPTAWIKRFHRKNPIIGIEMLAPLALLWSSPSFMRHVRANLYIDNDSASNSLIRGDCVGPFLAAMINFFLDACRKSPTRYLDRQGRL